MYRKVWLVVISILAVLLIIFAFVFWITKNYNVLGNDYFQYALVMAFLVAILTPLSAFSQVMRAFKSTYKLSEPTIYEFSDEGYSATGESFTSKSDWSKVYKVQIIKGWLILYLSRHAANMVKIGTDNENNIEALKQMLKTGNFKAKLKW